MATVKNQMSSTSHSANIYLALSTLYFNISRIYPISKDSCNLTILFSSKPQIKNIIKYWSEDTYLGNYANYPISIKLFLYLKQQIFDTTFSHINTSF